MIAEMRGGCQLRRTAAPTLALKIAAGRIEAIADEIERAAIAPAAAKGRGGGEMSMTLAHPYRVHRFIEVARKLDRGGVARS